MPEELEKIGLSNEIAGQITRSLVGIVAVPEFSTKKLSVKVSAKVYGKSESWVRNGIFEGWLPIGHATASESRKNVYISLKRLWEAEDELKLDKKFKIS